MSKRTRHRAAKRPPTQPPPELDDTELDLRELGVLWSRLEEALQRDGVAPTAGGGGGGGSSGKSAPPPLDLDTQRAMVLIETELRDLEAEAIRILNIRPATAVLAELRRDRTRLLAASADAALNLMAMRGHRRTAVSLCHRDRPHVHGCRHQELARAEAEALRARNAIRDHDARIRRVEHRRTVAGLLELLPAWYVQLRDRKQPLARHLGQSTRRCLGHARDALRLQTREERIGWPCPHHRDEPAELVRDRDEARLSESVLAGRAQAVGEAPLTWKRAESVHCPKCKERWAGVEQLRVLMRMIEEADQARESTDG